MRQKIDRTDETAYNTKGRLMKIVIYNNANDMVVEFEDGTRVKGVRYDNFKRGWVGHPKGKTKAEDRVGETVLNSKGRLMKIVEYHSSANMVVEFVEDGTRVSGVTYVNFKKGKVCHPKDKVKAEDRVGETAYNTQGRLMKIVEYHISKNIVVEFEDGTRVSEVQYSEFKKGNVRHPKDKTKAENRVGETTYNTQGRLMKIVEYPGYKNMVVEFEDGTRVSGVYYSAFKKGNVCHPKDKVTPEDRVGETAHNTKGRLMKIVEYHGYSNIVVEFEDGTRVSGVRYGAFKKGNVCHPKDKVTVEDRVGETAHNTQGRLMKIVEYHSCLNMVVEFEDGTRVNGVYYRDFKKGMVRHPIDKTTAEDRVGETAYNNQGRLMKIVVYHNNANMVVEFEDGTRVSGVQYDNFKKGWVRHPNDKVKAEDRVGETSTASNGQTLIIVEYTSAMNVKIQFLGDDLPPTKTTYQLFKSGTVKSPHFPMRGKGRYKTLQTEYAYTTPSGEVYFYCECQRCGWKKNMTADEAVKYSHVCKEKDAENYVKEN